jgi:hypothetical protein
MLKMSGMSDKLQFVVACATNFSLSLLTKLSRSPRDARHVRQTSVCRCLPNFQDPRVMPGMSDKLQFVVAYQTFKIPALVPGMPQACPLLRSGYVKQPGVAALRGYPG